MPERSQPPDGGPHDVLAAEEFGVGVADPRLHHEPPHDVLAAEEFIVPAADPRLHDARPHDVLAAEEYALPAPDPILHHHGPVRLPEDPAGRGQPRDVLAAEEYALPAPPPSPADGDGHDRRGAARSPRRALMAGLALGLLATRRRRRRS
jgi:hypothetical protein